MERCDDQPYKMRNFYTPRDQGTSQVFINIMMGNMRPGCRAAWNQMKYSSLFPAQYFSWIVNGSNRQYTIKRQYVLCFSCLEIWAPLSITPSLAYMSQAYREVHKQLNLRRVEFLVYEDMRLSVQLISYILYVISKTSGFGRLGNLTKSDTDSDLRL